MAFSELLTDTSHAQCKGISVVAPRAFKRTIGTFHHQFAGWKQQDAQEFLSMFLAGLSEDVNRTLVKPYNELKDSDGRADAGERLRPPTVGLILTGVPPVAW